jgi:hypothetical protein
MVETNLSPNPFPVKACPGEGFIVKGLRSEGKHQPEREPNVF